MASDKCGKCGEIKTHCRHNPGFLFNHLFEPSTEPSPTKPSFFQECLDKVVNTPIKDLPPEPPDPADAEFDAAIEAADKAGNEYEPPEPPSEPGPHIASTIELLGMIKSLRDSCASLAAERDRLRLQIEDMKNECEHCPDVSELMAERDALRDELKNLQNDANENENIAIRCLIYGEGIEKMLKAIKKAKGE